MKFYLSFLLIVLFALPAAFAEISAEDQAYIAKFQEAHGQPKEGIRLADVASPEAYDKSLGAAFDGEIANVNNDQGGMAWATAYRMTSLNEMYRATKDTKYLEANQRMAAASLAARDDKVGKKLWNGELAKAWGCDKYSKAGRCIFTVHTGMIAYPILDFLLLAKENREFKDKMGAEWDRMLAETLEALGHHNRGWRKGPEEGAGYYESTDKETDADGKPLPANWHSAMGRAHWIAWKVAGDEEQRNQARAIAVYLKNRFYVYEGAYYWVYWPDEEAVKETKKPLEINGEDSSHAALTASPILLMAPEDEVFGAEDMKKLGAMIRQGMGRLGEGILFGTITGDPKAEPSYATSAARWLPVGNYDEEAGKIITEYFLKYRTEHLAPLDIAMLLRFGRE